MWFWRFVNGRIRRVGAEQKAPPRSRPTPAPARKPPRLPLWRVGELEVRARTRSEARGAWKRQTGLSRVPVGCPILRLEG